ncbi:MAG: hypothetical protein WEC84_03085 [Candidatus Andersenbacteria bacterium]
MDVKILIVATAILLLLQMYLRYKRSVLPAMGLAFLAALTWTTYYRYEYVGENMLLLDRINVYPLTLWTLGLTTLYVAHTHMRIFRHPLMITLLHVAGLAAIEMIGYHLLHVRIDDNFTSLLGLGVIHAPLKMKVFYVIAGPIYIFAIDIYQKMYAPLRRKRT